MKSSYLTMLFATICTIAYSQAPSKRLKNNPYKNSQWYVGLNGGVNYSFVNVINDYSIIAAANSLDKDLYEKDYGNKVTLGAQYGLQLLFQFEQRLVFGSGLQISELKFDYAQALPNLKNSIQFNHTNKFRYLEIPLVFRFMIRQLNSDMWNTSWKKPSVPAIVPYVQAGLNFGFLLSANKEVNRVVTANEFTLNDLSFSEDVSGLLSQSTFGVLLGIGARYRLGNIYLTTELNLKQAISNLSNENTRYANENLIDNAYDIFDDMSATQIAAQIGILVPIKYLSKREFLPVEL